MKKCFNVDCRVRDIPEKDYIGGGPSGCIDGGTVIINKDTTI